MQGAKCIKLIQKLRMLLFFGQRGRSSVASPGAGNLGYGSVWTHSIFDFNGTMMETLHGHLQAFLCAQVTMANTQSDKSFVCSRN
jgi:hypothetical protein